MKKLIAIDGNSLMYRAYYALPSMTTKNGTPTGAIYGFLNMLLKLLDYAPDYLLVAFDMHGPTFRHEQYSQYKAGRKETPDDLRKQFPILKDLLKEMKIAVCECQSFEADDILGTFSRIANEQDISALLVTGDRDALQLISDNTHVLMTKKGISETIEYDRDVLKEHYGLTPDRMVDLKALMGDSSDNIPGISGIGEKTALKLLEKYGDLESILSHADDEKGALSKKLKEGVESAKMSYALGLINTNAPVHLTVQDCRFDKQNMRKALPLLRELELRSLANRLPEGENTDISQITDKKIKHLRIDNEEDLKDTVAQLENTKELALHIDEALSVSIDGNTQYDIVLGATLLDAGLDEEQVILALKNILENKDISKIVFDSKRLRHIFSRYDIELENVSFDAMIADYLLNAIHPTTSLKTLSAEKTGVEDAGAASLILLKAYMMQELKEKELYALYEEVELPLANVLYGMEKEGISVDKETLKEMSTLFKSRIDDIAKQIYMLAGEQFNILSPKQLSYILFEKLALPAQKKTKSGYSTDSEVLEAISHMHEIVPLVIEYRTLSKLLSTFLEGLISSINAATGKVHTTFNQNVTATGRISSTEPNLQNIPVRTELGREIRKAFIASKGNVIVDADYSQIELRVLAHISNDERMIAAFNADEDIHRRTASEVFNVDFESVTGEQRSAAKAVNFGIVYGISDFGLAKNLGISRKDAKMYIDMYLERYADIHRYMNESIEMGKKKGYVSTLLGRRRDLPEINSSNYNVRSFGERVAMNMPIQGTAADIIKLAMVKVDEALKKGGYKAKLVLQVHDELIVDAPAEEADKVKELLVDCMENVMKLAVPLKVEAEIGNSWYETK